MALALATDPTTYRYATPIVLTLGGTIGMYMQRHYTLGFLLNRVLDRVEQLPKLALQSPPPLLVQVLPSTTVHTMRSYVIEEPEDHAFWVADGDTRIWRHA